MDQATTPLPFWLEVTLSCLRALAGLLTIPAILLLVTVLNLTHWRLTWLNPSFLKSIPIRHKLYERLPGMVLDVVLEDAAISSGEPELVAEFEYTFGWEALETLAAAFLPPEWVQGQVEQNIDAFFTYLEGETSYPYLQINLTDLREHVTSDEVRNALRDVLAPLPPCERDYDFYSGDIPQCRPSQATLNEMLDEMGLDLDDAYPLDLSFQEVIENDRYQEQILSDFEMVQQGFRIFNWSIRGLWLPYLLLMGFILLVFARSLDGFLLWVAWPTLVGSGIAVLKYGVTLFFVPLLIQFYRIAILPPDIPVAPIAHLGSIINAFNLDLQCIGLLLSGGLALLSGLAVAGAFLLRRFQIESHAYTSDYREQENLP
jgi:hypothetical protein